MSTQFKIELFGVILLIIGIIILGISNVFLKTPSDEAVATLEFGGSELSKTISLEVGEYEIWYQNDDPGHMEISDVNDNFIRIEGSHKLLTINNQHYEREGSFKIENAGEYIFVVKERCTLYLTDDFTVGPNVDVCFAGIILGLLGGIMLIIGIIIGYATKKKEHPIYTPPAQQSYQPPPIETVCTVCGSTVPGGALACQTCGLKVPMQRAIPPLGSPTTPSTSQYPCPTCGQPLTFEQLYQKWYCNQCDRYLL